MLVHDKDDNNDDAKVVEMMKEGDWRRVLQEFQGDDCYREPLLVDIYAYLHMSTPISYLHLVSRCGSGPASSAWSLSGRR